MWVTIIIIIVFIIWFPIYIHKWHRTPTFFQFGYCCEVYEDSGFPSPRWWMNGLRWDCWNDSFKFRCTFSIICCNHSLQNESYCNLRQFITILLYQNQIQSNFNLNFNKIHHNINTNHLKYIIINILFYLEFTRTLFILSNYIIRILFNYLWNILLLD